MRCNSRGASKCRSERKGGAQLEPWQGEIQFRHEMDSGRPYIECEDNGVGMGLPELEGCFAKAGRRFHDMPEFLEEQTEWLRVKPEVRLFPNSQFGVGVFSYFMLADEIEIETCRFNRDGSPGRIIRVYISGSGSLFRVSVGKRGRRSGTRVRLYLGRTTYADYAIGNEVPISCLSTLDDVLHVAEYRTTCSQTGSRVRVWNPGELSEERSRDAVRLDDDLWVTEDSRGLLLADGIAVEDPLSHLIVNLRRQRRPHLSVNRKSIIAWDQQWIRDILRSQWSKLVDWSPHFTTLWWLDNEFPDVAVRLTDALMQRRGPHRQPYGGAPVRLDEVGCCAGDVKLYHWAHRQPRRAAHHWREILHDLLEQLPFDPQDGLAFVMQRFELWRSAGAHVDSQALETIDTCAQEKGVRPVAAAACIPRAGDWFVLKQVSEAPAGLVACARSLGETVQQTAERLVKYAPFMGDVLTIVAGAASFVPEPDDLIFLSRDGDGEAPWLRGTASLIHMVKVARVLGRPVESLLAQYPRYEFLDIHTPTFSREELEAALPKDEADRLLLTPPPAHQRPLNQISFMWLVETAVRTGRPLGSLLERLHAFEKVGVTGEPLDFVPTAGYQPEEMDLGNLAQIHNVLGGIALGSLLDAVVSWDDPGLFAVARRIGLLPADCSDEVIAALAIDEVDVRILSHDGDGRPPWIDRKLSRSHIGDVAREQNLDEQDLVRRVQRMAPLGVELLEQGELQVL